MALANPPPTRLAVQWLTQSRRHMRSGRSSLARPPPHPLTHSSTQARGSSTHSSTGSSSAAQTRSLPSCCPSPLPSWSARCRFTITPLPFALTHTRSKLPAPRPRPIVCLSRPGCGGVAEPMREHSYPVREREGPARPLPRVPSHGRASKPHPSLNPAYLSRRPPARMSPACTSISPRARSTRLPSCV